MAAPCKGNASTERATVTLDLPEKIAVNARAQKTAVTTVLAVKATAPVIRPGEVSTARTLDARRTAQTKENAKTLACVLATVTGLVKHVTSHRAR